jgi:formate--tetrahydrofolate ligase
LPCKAKELADKGLDKDFAPIVDPSSRAEEKIDTIAKKIYGADKVEYTDLALQQLAAFRKAGIPVDSYSVVISKTPNSLSDNAKLLNVPKHTLHVESFRLFTGAKFLVPLTWQRLHDAWTSEGSGCEEYDVYGKVNTKRGR